MNDFLPSPPLTAEWMGQVLDENVFPDLYLRVRDEGMPYFPRENDLGRIELCLVFESVEEFSFGTRDETSIEWKTYRNKLLAIVWTRTDPRQPLAFPIAFDCSDQQQRTWAVRMAEQTDVQVHHLVFQEGRVLHVFSESVPISDKERHEVLALIERLRTDSIERNGMEEVREEPAVSVSALELAPQELCEEGAAYSFHYARMTRRLGGEAANHLLMNAVFEAMQAMRRHPQSRFREAVCTVWVAEAPPLLYVAVTPCDLFQGNGGGGEENPFSRMLASLTEFAGIRRLLPLSLGAYPIFRYDRGRLFHLELDDSFSLRLAEQFARLYPERSNPYLAGASE